MRRHLLSMLQRAAIGQVSSDAGCSKRMITDRRADANSGRSAVDHSPRIRLRHGPLGHRNAEVASGGFPEKPPLAVLGDGSGVDVGPQRLGQRVVAGHDLVLAASWPTGAQRARTLELDANLKDNVSCNYHLLNEGCYAPYCPGGVGA